MTQIVLTLPVNPRSNFYRILNDISHWHDQMGIPQHRVHTINKINNVQVWGADYQWTFEQNELAILFKLTWGGQ